MQSQFSPSSDLIYTVSQLNNEARFLLEDTFPFIWIEGEISNFAAPNSGHWYFCLKDAQSQVRCAMFKMQQRQLLFIPKNGARVLVKARVSLYENRGEFQLIVESMEDRGEGKLRLAFEQLKKKLQQLGYFDANYKKTLPAYPRQIGIITSPTGAALRDILSILKRRHASVPLILYPTLVQGATAAIAIAKTIEKANERNECDVLLLARGGGSLEDLWAFNEEIVALAIHGSKIPIITGIGHEIDFTIADFVADIRAPTPSAAAEVIARDSCELLSHLKQYENQLHRSNSQKISLLKQHVTWLHGRLQTQHPKRKMMDHQQRLDLYETTLIQRQIQLFRKIRADLQQKVTQYNQQLPTYHIQRLKDQTQLRKDHLAYQICTYLGIYQKQLASFAAKLDALNPLATLYRGYAIATKDGKVITDSNTIKIGDQIKVQLHKGLLHCLIQHLK